MTQLLVLLVCIFSAVEMVSGEVVMLESKRNSTRIVGELLGESTDTFELLNITTAKKQTLRKTQTVTHNGEPRTVDRFNVKRDLSPETICQVVGIGDFVAWRFSKSVPSGDAQGTIAKVEGNGKYYCTLGRGKAIARDQELLVYRGKDQIKDPNTGEVLGVERRQIARVNVVDVKDKYSKVRIAGDFDVSLEVGDIVEPESKQFTVAVVPFLNKNQSAYRPLPSGATRVGGGREPSPVLTTRGAPEDEITSSLVKYGLVVVERERQAHVLRTLEGQRSRYFNPTFIKDLGKQIGATMLVVGSYDLTFREESQSRRGRYTDTLVDTVYSVRLVLSESGEIIDSVNVIVPPVTE